MANNGATEKHTVVLRKKADPGDGSYVWIYDFDDMEKAINFGNMLEKQETTLSLLILFPNGAVIGEYPR